MRRILFLLALAACADPPKPAVTPRPPVVAPDPPAAALPAVPAVTMERRIAVFSERPSGTVETQVSGDTVKIATVIVQNGRGPKTQATLHLAEDGTISALSIKGTHTFGTKVDESFSREGKAASWKSEEESGEVELDGPAFYTPIATVYGIDGFLVAAALKHGGKLRVLPTGEVTVEKVAEASLTANGQTRQVHAYYLRGLELAPNLTWMNADGSWFGEVDESTRIVPEGWDEAAKALQPKALEIRQAWEAKLATTYAKQPPSAGVAFTHARVLDVAKGRWLTDQTVVVVGETITAVGPKVAIPAGAQTIDLAGKAIIPGLVDMHVHLTSPDGVMHIASGVTTVRDVGNDPDSLDADVAKFDANATIGPRVIRYGFIEGKGEKAAASKVTATNPDEAAAAVDYFAKRGYQGIKIYNSVDPALVPVLAKLAHAKGLKVIGHIPKGMRAEEAVRAGYDGIEHINQVLLNFFVTPDTDTRDLTRFTLPGAKVATLDFKSKPVKDFVALLAKQQTLIDPTFVAFEGMYMQRSGTIVAGLETMAGRMPPLVQRWFVQNGLPDSDTMLPTYQQSFAQMLAFAKLLHDAKIPIVLGTDGLAGVALHREMALFVKAGLSPAAVLRLVTIDSAKALGLGKQIGTIAKGKRADFVVVDGDPLADITAIGKTVTTLRGGVMYDARSLYEAVGIRPL